MAQFGESERVAAARLIELALAEDCGPGGLAEGDATSRATIPEGARGRVDIVAREPGVLAGLPIVGMVFEAVDPAVQVETRIEDGATLCPGDVVAVVSGATRSLLLGERTALNFLAHLSGVATLTRAFVAAVADTRTIILDTRKTLPGWRELQKYAVRCGGGINHRRGLFDGVLIKDNHLAAWWRSTGDKDSGGSPAEAVRRARRASPPGMTIEIEVDSIEQLAEVLPARPDIVLLDNMSPDELRAGVALRDRESPDVRLEASGGITLENVRAMAATGVDRISIGALTHSAPALDLGFDWESG